MAQRTLVCGIVFALVAACGGSHARTLNTSSTTSSSMQAGDNTSSTARAGHTKKTKAKAETKAKTTTTTARTSTTRATSPAATTSPETTTPAPIFVPPPTSPPTTAAPAPPPNLASVRIKLNTVVTGLDSPVALAWRKNDSTMYVAQQTGKVVAVQNGHVLATPTLSLSVSHGNEQGVLGIAFSPDGTRLYVDYTDPSGNTHVDEYQMQGTVAKASTRRQVLYQAQPYPNHNGGELIFGNDGMLYIGLGDGGSGGDPNNNGQNLGTWLGKILRISPYKAGSAPYSVPSSNPFVHHAGAKPEIWAYGLRNPWRFSFDRTLGDMWIGDVGQDLYEEIDWVRAGTAGVNYGWSQREGLHPYKGAKPAGAVDPVMEKSHNSGYCAIIGGYVYRGSAVPKLRGVYLFGDDCRANVTGAVLTNGRVTQQKDLGPTVDQLTSFGQDLNGELYAVSRDGVVYRFVAG